MKILTLNTHSHIEADYEKKLFEFVNAIYEIKPDVIALQEVNQSVGGRICKENDRIKTVGKIPLREDNHLLVAMTRLSEMGLRYNAVWCGIKNGYPGYEEGGAVMSLSPIEAVRQIPLTKSIIENKWKTRAAVGIMTKLQWFYSVHMGWWDDDEEPFLGQWNILKEETNSEKTWLMGDFNNPAHIDNEGYKKIIDDGWFDAYTMAANKDSGYTANTKIAGWYGSDERKIRIDYIFTNKKTEIESSFVIFDGNNYPKISDHNGIVVTY